MSDIDWDFITGREVKNDTERMYASVPRVGRSGVTIASGVDLGQMSIADINALGLPLSLTETLERYVGVKRQEAVNILEKFPLKISVTQADLIDAKMRGRETRRLIKRYNEDSKVDFNNVPPSIQTAIMSYAWQKGTNFRARSDRASRDYWQLLTEQDWIGAHKMLLRFPDEFPTRRKSEAKLFEPHIPDNERHSFTEIPLPVFNPR